MTYEITTRPQNGMVTRKDCQSRHEMLTEASKLSKIRDCAVDANIFDKNGELVAQASFYAGEVIV